MTQLLPNIFAIEVPRGTTALALAPNEEKPYILQGHISGAFGEIQLPPGSYEILFTTKGVSEEHAQQIVEKLAGLSRTYRDYHKSEWYRTATNSLHSLLRSKGLTATNYLLIKKVG